MVYYYCNQERKRKEVIKMVIRAPIDPLNFNNSRNIQNTCRFDYNCGGYALETYSWYQPHEKGRHLHYGFNTIEEAYETTMYAVATMVKEFEGKIRMLKNIKELDKENERVVAFRISSDGDFHYVKKTSRGWQHKMGGSPEIRKMRSKEVFSKMWCDRYDGPIVFLAIKK